MLSLLDRCLRVVLTALAFVGFYLGGVFLSWIVLPVIWRRSGSSTERALRCQDVVSGAFVLFHDYMRVARLIRFDPRAVAGLSPEGACVIIANHPTLVDVTAIIASYGRVFCVAKNVLFRSPLVGRLLRYCGHIDGDSAGAV